VAKGRASATATVRDRPFWTIVAHIVAAAPLTPAILVNLDNASGNSLGWLMCAIGIVIGSAVFIEAGKLQMRESQWPMGILFVFLGLVLLALNMQNALVNASATSDRRSDDRGKIIADGRKASSQRSQWVNDRTEQSQIAGATAPSAFEAQMQQLISSESRRWQQTDQCDPLKTTAGASREFCSAVAALRQKKAAAEKRDELDAKIAKLDEETADAPAVSSVDPFADTVAEFLTLFDVNLDERKKSIISRSKDWGKTLGLELLATFGPSALLCILLPGASRRREEPEAKPVAPKPEPKRALTPAPAPVASVVPVEAAPAIEGDDPVHLFIAECLEQCAGSTMPANEPWVLWLEWANRKGVPVGTQKGFGMKLKRTFAHDRNNNRPRYLNCRAKTAPAIRLAVSNG
jgi:hypothetical protein